MKPVYKCDYCSYMGTARDVKEHEPMCSNRYDQITAVEARDMVHAKEMFEELKTGKPIDAWDKLFIAIEESAKCGFNEIIFNEEKQSIKFKEHRKKVKNRLEELGYNVSYHREEDNSCLREWHDIVTYHNVYEISW